ncbi:hypothetical protein PUNSTDRAFT_77500 [Punctularia strigosozonata HHB-11173 SS5]|uniref:Tc1-like transposase DDE domain-containing protein n=2 Tax=Punctularia strigosozonata (strain HHB-11173) TaxID=741275 RepID=R7S3Q8_PUNST|nr:uncharacterized protein PUNSTDRAFT_77500 [Punctularia strigosozonata HHB-11173 SS5]EIN03861.1 hypothetical protein PUNSTDRAFT_77500 [Punctularia strigosozonata HHB-11173 SS5]
MGFRTISDDVKLRALHLIDRGLEREAICSILGVSLASLTRWKHNFEEHDSLARPPRSIRGRPSRTTGEQRSDILNLLIEAPDLYLDEVQQWLAIAHELALSKTAIHDLINDSGYTYKKLQKSAIERDEGQRATWRQTEGDRAPMANPLARGVRYSVVAALSLSGYVSTRVVEGSVNAYEFFDFIVEEVLPRMNPYPQDQSVLILDNCSIHKMDTLRRVVEGQGLCLMLQSLIPRRS